MKKVFYSPMPLIFNAFFIKNLVKSQENKKNDRKSQEKFLSLTCGNLGLVLKQKRNILFFYRSYVRLSFFKIKIKNLLTLRDVINLDLLKLLL